MRASGEHWNNRAFQKYNINIITDIYNKNTSPVKLDRLGSKINIHKEVKQGDPISPIMFIVFRVTKHYQRTRLGELR